MRQPFRRAESAIPATVSRVIHGDSLDAHVHNRRTAIGYLGAEAPTENEPCGPEALERNRMLAGDRVLLEEDPAHPFLILSAVVFSTRTLRTACR